MAAPQASSRLEMLQARFQQRQLLEKEQKLLQLYDQQQLRAHQVAQRGSAGSNGSNSSGNGTRSTMSHHQTVTRTTTSTHSTNSNSQPGGKVRQMFDERRQTSVKGIDKSYPLEPLDNRSRKQQSTTTTSNVVVSSTSPMKNGNPMSNRQSIVTRRTVRSEANSNVNGGKPIVSYHEEVSRESCGPSERDNNQEEFGDDDNGESLFANGNRNVDRRNEMHIEDVTNDNSTQRHRTTAKIHLSEFDSNDPNRIGDNLENEQFPEDLMIDSSEPLPKRGPAPKKSSQAEARLERFKNSNTKRPSPVTKQLAGNTTSYTKKRTETNVHSGSTSRVSTVTKAENEGENSMRATSPIAEFEVNAKPRSLTPEERARKLTHPVVDRSSIIAKTPGITKVSQITHKNSMDFYPRRKSEFEKSKTFRKLQLELGESSPEPAEPEEEVPTTYTRPCKKRSSILDDNIYNPDPRSSSSSPTTHQDTSKDLKSNRDESLEYLQTSEGSESPICGTKSSEKKEEISTSSFQSHTYSSRRRSSALSQNSDRQTFEDRRASREMSPEHQPLRKGSKSPVYERESTTKRKETKTNDEGRHSTNVKSDFYSSRRRSSSSCPTINDHPSKVPKVNREKSPECSSSRQRSESPIYKSKSIIERVETKTADGGRQSTKVESDFYSSRHRSSFSCPTIDDHPSKGPRVSQEKSPERSTSRKGSESPIYERESIKKKAGTKTTDERRYSTDVEIDSYSSRRRSSSSRSTIDERRSKRSRASRENTPERSALRKGSESPIYKRELTKERAETKTLDGGRYSTNVEIDSYSSRRRSSSSRSTIDEHRSKRSSASRENTPERSALRKGSKSPIYERELTKERAGTKTLDGGRYSTNVEIDSYSSRHRSSTSCPTIDDHLSKGPRVSREKSPERSALRKGSESPIYDRESTKKRAGTKTTDRERYSTNVEIDSYSSRRRSSSSRPHTDDNPSKGQKVNRKKSSERSSSRKGSNPNSERELTKTKAETKTSEGGRYCANVGIDFRSTKRRSPSSRPAIDDNPSKGQRISPEKCMERPRSRIGSESPVHGKKFTVTSVEIRTKSGGIEKTGQESNIYCSRRRSSSSSPTDVYDPQEVRRSSREMSPEQSSLRTRSEGPIYEKRSIRRREETKSPDGQRHSTRVETSNFFSSKHQASSPRSSKDSRSFKGPGRKISPEKSPDHLQSRKGSKSPIPATKSTVINVEIQTTNIGSKTTEQKPDIYLSRRRSSSSSLTALQYPQEKRGKRPEISPERPESRRESVTPFYKPRSTASNVEIETTTAGTKTMGQESNIHSSRRRSSSSSPTAPHDCQERRTNSPEISPLLPKSRRGSESPTFAQISTVTNKNIITTHSGNKSTCTKRKFDTEEPKSRNQSPICVRLTRERSESPSRAFRRTSDDHEDVRRSSDHRKNSAGTLRSVELVKKIARSGNSDRATTTSSRQSSKKMTTLEDVELLNPDSRQRSKSSPHRVVKKEKVVMEISRENESKMKDIGRKDSDESRRRTGHSRSRTASPSPQPSRSMMETASFKAKKAERKNSSEAKRTESKKHQHDLTHVISSSSPVDDRNDQSRRSSAEITVKRHETFNVSKPTYKIIKIDRESSVDDDDDLPADKPIKTEVKDKSNILERIEKIRTTLSKSGRSEQNLQDAEDFERTDSVESALRRFDSIGVEIEHHVTVGVDEIDRSLGSSYPQPVSRSMKEIACPEQRNMKKSIDSGNTQNKITVAVIKSQPTEIDRKTYEPSKDKISKTNTKEKIFQTTKSMSNKKEKSETIITPRQSSKPRTNPKITTSFVRKSKLRGEESSGRGEGKITDRSPDCKRRLFDDPESEVEIDNNKSTVVMSNYTIVNDDSGFGKIGTANNRDNIKIGNEIMIRSDSSIKEMGSEQEQQAKVLRSIEDIRKSIKRESQDFNRELEKFNTAMKKDKEIGSWVAPEEIIKSGIISCVKITKTLKPGDVKPVVKIERSTVKLPITHRVAKSPSPDIGVKRSTEGRARTPTASVRKTVPSSPAKSPDAISRHASSELKSAEKRTLVKTSQSPSAAKENRIRSEVSQITEYSDCTDGPSDHSELAVTETVSSTTTKGNDAFIIELDDDDVYLSKSSQGKPLLRKQSTEKSLTSQKTQRSPTATPLPRPASALSTSSTGSARGQSSHINSKSKMATKAKTPTSTGAKGPPGGARGSTAPATNDGLAPCKICGRRFNSDRISLHEQICSKTATKKRKQFDTTIHRVKGTELEQFVVKKGTGKKGAADRKTKPEVKSNWRRKHEDFINAIRSAKQVQAHLAAGGKLSDLPPPPPSDTSDYIQCPHCGRKFNQTAAERHIPKCQTMMHNKPNPRAPPKPKR